MAEIKDKYTNYERTRILGARALQVAMDAPLLMKIPEAKLDELHYNPMEIANVEFESGVLPISVKQPMPQKKAVAIKKVVEAKKESDKAVLSAEEAEEEEIVKEGEIMELANPEDEDSGEEAAEGRAASEELQ